MACPFVGKEDDAGQSRLCHGVQIVRGIVEVNDGFVAILCAWVCVCVFFYAASQERVRVGWVVFEVGLIMLHV